MLQRLENFFRRRLLSCRCGIDTRNGNTKAKLLHGIKLIGKKGLTKKRQKDILIEANNRKIIFLPQNGYILWENAYLSIR